MYNQTPNLPHASTLIKFASKTNGIEETLFDCKKTTIEVKNMDLNGIVLPVPFKIHSPETQIREQAFSRILERVNLVKNNELQRPKPVYSLPENLLNPTVNINPASSILNALSCNLSTGDTPENSMCDIYNTQSSRSTA